TYFPAPYLSDVSFMYQTAYQIDKFKLINVIAVAQKHIDQGISKPMVNGLCNYITCQTYVWFCPLYYVHDNTLYG
ncbi:MAG: hypothetical protein Q8755_02515, partial [Candidatus Phytoplasma australasiaticum]|nr:hypothetical protein [Candidatus Phytoplasma australasiaticum]